MAVRRRTRKLTEEKQTQICAAVTLGCSRRAAARLASVSPQAIIKLEKTDPLFAERMEKARFSREAGPLRAIHAAAQKNWRAAAWVLQRFHPADYVPQRPNVVTAEQIGDMIQRFADVICGKLPAKQRQEILVEVDRLVKEAQEEWRAGDEVCVPSPTAHMGVGVRRSRRPR